LCCNVTFVHSAKRRVITEKNVPNKGSHMVHKTLTYPNRWNNLLRERLREQKSSSLGPKSSLYGALDTLNNEKENVNFCPLVPS
jgi:hypothetical protein